MRGSVIKRGGSYSVVLDLGRDPATGKRRRTWHSGYHTRKDAEKARTAAARRFGPRRLCRTAVAYLWRLPDRELVASGQGPPGREHLVHVRDQHPGSHCARAGRSCGFSGSARPTSTLFTPASSQMGAGTAGEG